MRKDKYECNFHPGLPFEMSDLAQQAFTTNNFDLAAQIYERLIANDGPSVEVCLSLGDSLAKAGNFSRAFESYSNAFRIGGSGVRLEKLNHLVSALVDEISRQDLIPKTKEEVDMFSCSDCRALLQDPITIPCGHSFCRKCLDKNQSRTCKKCSTIHHYSNFANIKTNVLLLSLLERWFPSELESIELKSRGNELFSRGNFKEAIHVYNDAITRAPHDHLLISNRSIAFASLDRHSEALQDAELVIQLKPHWPKGYFRKAEALCGMRRYEESVIAFLQCLALDPSVTTARKSLAKVLHKLLSPLSPEELKHSELQSAIGNYNSVSAVFSGINSSANRHIAGPLLSPELLLHLKDTLREKVTKRKLQDLAAECLNYKDKPLGMNDRTDSKGRSYDQSCKENACDPAMGLSDSEKQQLGGSLSKCYSAPSLLEKKSRSELCASHQKKSAKSIVDKFADCKIRKKRSHSLSSESAPSLSTPGHTQNKHSRSDGAIPKKGPRHVDDSLLNIEDFECSLCYRTLYQPVSTPCGHTFCKHCLDRSMDHSSLCPLCKGSLVEYLAERRQATTEAIESILLKYFSQDYEIRKKVHEEELANLARMVVDNQHEVPIFVCTMAFPSVPCPLHVFEPRYRLMIRQCMEAGTRQFGMCAYRGEEESNFADYGCMLEIQDVQYFPDGRSVVATVGGRRFKVLSRTQREGYHVAKVEFLEDQKCQGQEATDLQKKHDEIYGEAKTWIDSLSNSQRLRIQKHFGAFPDRENDIQANPNGVAWIWWLLAVLPLDPRAQLSILAMTLQKERLQAIARVLNFVKGRST